MTFFDVAVKPMDELLKKKIFVLSLFLALAATLLTRPLITHAEILPSVNEIHRTGGSDQSAVNELDRELFVIANTELTLAHEFAHLLIDELELPVFGNMENAADLIGLMLYSNLMDEMSTPIGMQIFRSIADETRMEWDTKEIDDQRAYWSLHPFEPQRFFNLACLIYGSDPESLEHLRSYVGLPYARAIYCTDEFLRAKKSAEWIVQDLRIKKHVAAYSSKNKDGNIKVVFEEPYSVNGNLVKSWVQKSGMVDRMVSITESLATLPRDVTLSFVNCSHAEGLWLSDKAEIVVCYQLMERYLYLSDVRYLPSEGVLSIADWSMFCMYESIADHYRDSHCDPVLKNPTPSAEIVTVMQPEARTHRGNILVRESIRKPHD